VPERWHLTLLIIAVASFSIIFNTLLARKLPLLEGIVLVLHIFGFFAIFITMWVLGPRSKASHVFGSFQDNAGWGNIGLSCLVGQLAPIFSLLGADAAAHLSEELRDASKILPRAMISNAIVNGSLGLAMLVTFCFCLGDAESVLATPTGQPQIQIMYDVTQSVVGATILSSIATIMVCTASPSAVIQVLTRSFLLCSSSLASSTWSLRAVASSSLLHATTASPEALFYRTCDPVKTFQSTQFSYHSSPRSRSP
jgi:amino acid transporter